MPKVRADAWPPCEPRLKASRVATMKMAGIAAREKNLQRVAKNLEESLKKSDLVTNLERVQTNWAAAAVFFLHRPSLQHLHRRSRGKKCGCAR